ncbi:unnamed protein product [Nippostrongylus brasiliensis]|uniref:Zinc metalloproteinase n=1 Tax=Nippostrongylus brasiliensis TaxID=27835 RepID=A0A0N4Y1U9_NIPBR|nr:unnamed protein product [Nippostrongylus brasiliensis]
MRLILILALIALTVSAGGFGSKLKDIFGGDALKEKLSHLKDVTKEKLKKALEGTELLKIGEKLKSLTSKVKAKLTLSPEKKAALKERLQKLVNLEKTQVKKEGDSITEINSKTNMGDMLFQHDLILTEDQLKEIERSLNSTRGKRQAWLQVKPWQNGEVLYSISPSATKRASEIFLKATKEWEANTCVRFKPVTSGPRVELISAVGCYSNIGSTGQLQHISLGDGCDAIGIATHEIGHTLGILHTMCRADRDQHVTVNVDNIAEGFEFDFLVQPGHELVNYGLPYEYGSIMHYGEMAGKKDPMKPVLVPKEENHRETMGSQILSFYDFKLINMHYFCDQKCQSSPITCKMGGYPNPNDCSKCLCPSGYGGKLCDEKPAGCGAILEATAQQKTLEKTIGIMEQDDYDTCVYWITAPEGQKIEITIDDVPFGISQDGCIYSGVEVKTQQDQAATGYRFCSVRDSGKTLTSTGNRVPIIFYSRKANRDPFKLKYRALGGAPNVGVPLSANCNDGIGGCAAKKLIGYCNKDEATVKSTCAKTCGKC